MQAGDDTKDASRLRTLLAEIDVASAMMSLVKYTREPDALEQYEQDGLRAYFAAMEIIATASLPWKQEQEVWDRLAPIRLWLENKGLLKR